MPKKTALAGATQEPSDEIVLEDLAGIVDQEYELVDVDAIEPHPENPNKGDLDAIGESIDENGWYGVCVVQRSTGYILAGSHRWKSAKARNAPRVPVIWKDVDDVVALRILLADNETARKAAVDKDQVGRILAQLGTVRGTGFRGLEELEADDRAQAEAEAAEEALPADEGLPYDPGDDVYEQQYGVIVVCESEQHQAEVYQQLKDLELTVRVVAV